MNVLRLHGFLGAPACWDAALGSPGEGTLAPWLPGHGPAPWRAGSFDDAVDAIAARIDRPAEVVGYSMGARIALRLAVRHPARVGRLVLVGAHPGIVEEAARADRARWEDGLSGALRGGDLGAFVARWEELPVLKTARPVAADAEERRRRWRLGHDPSALADALGALGLGRMPASWDALDTIRIPVVLAVGAEDERFLAVARAMAGRLTDVQLVVVPAAGHDLTLEAPDVVAALVSRRR